MDDETPTKAAGTAGTNPHRTSEAPHPQSSGSGENGVTGENGATGENGVTAEARRMKEDAKAKAAELKEGARGKARDTKAAVKATVEDAREGAEKRVDRWTETMGERVEHFAGALRAASDSLSSQGEKALAGIADDAAEQVTRVGGYLETEDSSAMMADLLDMGRRNPGAFLGSALAVGLAAGRFLRASSPKSNGVDSPREREEPSSRADAPSSRTDAPLARSSPGTTSPLSGSPGTMIQAGSRGGTP